MSLTIGVFFNVFYRLHNSSGDKEPCLVDITDHKIVVDCNSKGLK